MSVLPTAPPVAGIGRPSGFAAHPRRVRHQARDVLALMAFSAGASVTVAAGILLLASLGR